jgi:glycosyltransferase involved in cell wall biosynthesis
MKNLAIVSSYAEECGAAFYSSRLKRHLEGAGFTVDVKRLPLSLLRVGYPAAVRQKGDAEIRRIANELPGYDAVLLQFEPGLYGSLPAVSHRRVQHLLEKARKAIVTVHGFDRNIVLESIVSLVMHGRFDVALDRILNRSQRSAVDTFWRYVARAKHVTVLTFCHADQTFLERFHDISRIASFPITYFDQAEVAAIKAATDREQLLRQFGLDPRRKYFAVCGFLNPYKGHLTAIKALEYLPPDWDLAIVGGEHPHGIEAGRQIGPYVRQLLAFLHEGEERTARNGGGASVLTNSELGEILTRADLDRLAVKEDLFERSEFKHFLPQTDLRERVKFLGQVTDDAMPRFYAALDYIVHPYIRTREGQSGSGPATMALEFGTRSLFSNAPVFREMNLYFTDAMHFFNIGNFVELAESLVRFENFEKDLKLNRERALKTYNPAAMVGLYRDLLSA